MLSNYFRKYEYILYTVCITIVYAMTYINIGYTKIESLSSEHSFFVYAVCIVFLQIPGIIITFRRYRNIFSLLINPMIPIGLYGIISVGDLIPGIITAICVIAFVIFTGISLLLFFKKTKRDSGKRVVKQKIFACINCLRIISGFAMALVVLSIAMVFKFGMYPKKERAVDEEITYAKYIEDNIENISLIYDDKWKQLPVNDKLDALSIVANAESIYLGLDYKLKIIVTPLGENLAASLVDDVDTIKINSKYFDVFSGEELINIIAHEVYHSYQYRLSELYLDTDEKYQQLLIFNSAAQYVDEIEGYISCEDDKEGYRNQRIEQNADFYAEKTAGYYTELVAAYLNDELYENSSK